MFYKSITCLLLLPALLLSGCIITGKVADTNGNGIEGVTVTLTGEANLTTTTNSRGVYRFGNFLECILGFTSDELIFIMPGNYTVTPSKSEYSFTPISTDVLVTAEYFGPLSFVLPQPVWGVNFGVNESRLSISGTVRDENGFGLPGVPVNLTGPISTETFTDVEGEYIFEDLMPGSFTVTPSSEPYIHAPLLNTEVIAEVIEDNKSLLVPTAASITDPGAEFQLNYYHSDQAHVDLTIDFDEDSVNIIFENSGWLSLGSGSNIYFTFTIPGIPITELVLIENTIPRYSEYSIDTSSNTIEIILHGLGISEYSSINLKYGFNSNPLTDDYISSPEYRDVILSNEDLYDINFQIVEDCACGQVIDIDSCQTLDQKGAIYKLTEDVISTGTCFDIKEDTITLDGLGHRIIGNGGTGVKASGVSNITVKNLTISNCYYAIDLDIVKDSIISSNVLISNSGNGIGLYLHDSQQNEVIGNYAEGFWQGFYCAGLADDNVLSNNEAYGNKFGYSFRGSFNEISNCIGCDNVVNGIPSDVYCYPGIGNWGTGNQFKSNRGCPEILYSPCDN